MMLQSPMKEDTTFNGWKNYETWNVALYIQNDEGLYHMARELRNTFCPYSQFLNQLVELGSKETPDGVTWAHPNLSYDELNEMMEEL